MGLDSIYQGHWTLVFMFYLLSFLAAIIVIIFVHEFGHFIVGRWCGVKADVFSLGFGRELWGFNDRHGTRWKLGAIPLGGYVKFEGDANAASQPDKNAPLSPTSLHAQPVYKRAAIVAAGPIANFILAIAIFTFAFLVTGLPYLEPVVSQVISGSAADKAGIKAGDLVQSIDGVAVASFEDLQQAVWLRAGETLEVGVLRGGVPSKVSLVPETKELDDGFGGKLTVGLMGVRHDPAADEPHYRQFTPASAFTKAASHTWAIVSTTGKVLGRMITGSQSVKQIGSAATMAKGAGDAASAGPWAFLFFVGFLSVSIGLINLFPVPILDGGHLVYFAIEAVRGKPLGQQAQEWGYRIGFSVVVMLMVLGLFNDAGRLINWHFGT